MEAYKVNHMKTKSRKAIRKGTKKLGRPFKTVKPSKAWYVLAVTLGAAIGIAAMIINSRVYQTSCESDLRLYESIQSFK